MCGTRLAPGLLGARPPLRAWHVAKVTAADRTPLSEVMTRDVLCVLPDLDLGELTALLLELNIGGAPVVDDAGFPIGVVSRSDLVRSLDTGRTVGGSPPRGPAQE